MILSSATVTGTSTVPAPAGTQQKIGRPRQLYTGVTRRDYVAIKDRK